MQVFSLPYLPGKIFRGYKKNSTPARFFICHVRDAFGLFFDESRKQSAGLRCARACKEKAEVAEEDAPCGLRARSMRAFQERVYFGGIKSETTPGADAAPRGEENCCRRHTFKRLSRCWRPAGRRRPAPGRTPTRRRPGGEGHGKDEERGG